MTCRALAAAALLGAVAACASHRDAAVQPSPASAYDVALRAKAARLTALDRAAAEHRRAEIARVVSGSARDVTPPNATSERFVVQLVNRGARALRRIDGGVIVYGGRGLHRLGLAAFSANVDVAPGRSANVAVAIPHAAFGAEGAGALALANGMPKRVELELTGYRLESGKEQRETD
jgi:hypothetical protein